MIDTHSHILPGLDDGVPDLEQAIATARLALQDGIDGVICTPHWINGVFKNTRQVILKSIEEFKLSLEQHDVPLAVYPGAELRVDFELANRIARRELLTLNDTGSYALIELPGEIVPPKMEDFFYSLQIAGITPIVAHPERNLGLIKDPARLYGYIESGALTQLTARSLLGKFGGEVRRFSELMLEHGMAHFIATDAHGPKNRAPKLSDALREAEDIVGNINAHQIFRENPLAVVRGEAVTPFSLVPLGKRSSFSWKKCFSFWAWGR